MTSPPGDRDGSAEPLTIAALRAELGLTQQEFGERIGLPNKTSVSLLESGKRPSCSARIAVAIEALSMIDGLARIDAAELSEDVRLARQEIGFVHTSGHSPEPAHDHGG